MKKRDRVVWIDRGWQPVAIGFCPSRKAWKRVQREMHVLEGYPDIAGHGGHTLLAKNDKTFESVIIVTVAGTAERDAMDVIMTIVHEAVHVWQFLRNAIGESSPGIELEAYAIEEISRGLIDAYCKTQGKGRAWDNG